MKIQLIQPGSPLRDEFKSASYLASVLSRKKLKSFSWRPSIVEVRKINDRRRRETYGGWQIPMTRGLVLFLNSMSERK
ncbi:MAG TPA: hypothetical protein DCS89_11965 [Gammaproteobacteria bacterium]|jgi:hypothetical protein|nr:hypothetical protein [Gammaproteobacteria bacterium]